MPKYMLLYNGPATPMDQISLELGQKMSAGWQRWIESVGGAMVDVGSPLGSGRVVVDDGSEGAPTLINGYSIVEADNIDGALKLVDGHPFLSDKTGDFKVEVLEVLPTPGM